MRESQVLTDNVIVTMASAYAAGKPEWTAWSGHNLITNVARNQLASFLTGAAITAPNWIGLGTGTASATSVSASGLQFEVNRQSAVTRELYNSYSARYVATFGTTEGNGVLRELGLFTHSGIGTGKLWAIADISATKTTANTMSVTWFLAILTGSAL